MTFTTVHDATDRRGEIISLLPLVGVGEDKVCLLTSCETEDRSYFWDTLCTLTWKAVYIFRNLFEDDSYSDLAL
jgi:hypothetical protein